MNEKDKRVRLLKILIIVLAVCFFIGPFIFWNDVSRFNSTGLTIYFILHFVTFGGSILFFLHRYKKIASDEHR